MPKFIVERDFPGVGNFSYEELKEIYQELYCFLGEMDSEIQWLESYVTDDKVYCIYIAPDEATVRAHAERDGVLADRVSEVRVEIDPSTGEAAVNSHNSDIT